LRSFATSSGLIGAQLIDASRGQGVQLSTQHPCHISYFGRRRSLGRSTAVGSGGARSQIVLSYGVLALLCDPILDRVPIYRATNQVAALHEAIEGYSDIQFANIAPEATGSS
jgi:hypothetical protein